MAQMPEHEPTAARLTHRPSLLKIYLLQTVLLLLATIALWLMDSVMAYSTLFGGLISIAPNAYFARQAFRYSGAKAARNIANAFYRGEAGKFLLTVVLFAGVFTTVKPLHIVALFVAYVSMTVLNAVFAARIGNSRQGR